VLGSKVVFVELAQQGCFDNSVRAHVVLLQRLGLTGFNQSGSANPLPESSSSQVAGQKGEDTPFS
jgi:hypothetical protein